MKLTWYKDNMKQEKKRQKEYKSTQRFKELRRKYDKKNHARQLELKKQWIKNNPKRVKEQKKKDGAKYYTKNKGKSEFKKKRSIQHTKHYQKNRTSILAYGKKHNQIPEIKARRNETSRIRRRANPSSNRSGSIDLQLAMNEVRRRDGNTCQWQGCGLNHKQVSIHVHHIFPREKHPELELVEQYMICYCANHHGLWHRYNGDPYSEMIPARYQENGRLDECPSVRGRD